MGRPVIIFAIPSYNEAGTIGPLTQVIDKGLSRHFKKTEAYIVNADNDSPDDTKGAFLKTPTRHKKIYITSRGKPRSLRGKGFHMKMVFELAQKMNADAVGFIDGDVSSANPDWVRDLIKPVLQGEDHVLPIYLRNEYDGSITNHFCYPLLYGLLLTDLRQPIGGEIGLSRRAISLFLADKWHPSAYHYGVDIYLTTQSIFSSLRIAQIFIGAKQHKPSAPKLDPMFVQVADSLFRQLARHGNIWRAKEWGGGKVDNLRLFKNSYHTPELAFDYKYLKEGLLNELLNARPGIKRLFGDMLERELFNCCRVNPVRNRGAPLALAVSNKAKNGGMASPALLDEKGEVNLPKELWAQVLYKIIVAERIVTAKELLSLRALFFARFLTFYKEVVGKSHVEAEKEIRQQARLFRKMRGLAFE